MINFPDNISLEKSKAVILKIIDKQMERTGEDKFPLGWTDDGRYKMIGCDNWMSAFWTGMLNLAWEWTGDEKYRSLADKHIDIFLDRIIKKHEVWNHDLGFLYTLSCIASYKLTGNEKAKDTAIKAADHLYDNFYINKGAHHINAWADKDNMDKDSSFLIIDCLMNLPLLYWASDITGNSKYREAALLHTKTTAEYIFRDDDSTYHKYNFDVETGEPLYGSTAQGYSDDSCWSRGQAWGVYGFALAFGFTGEEKYLDCFKRCTDYFVSHLPEDYVPYWDFSFKEGDEPRDSSAAVIAACGILEAASFAPDDEKIKSYLEICGKITKSLIEKYAYTPDSEEDGLIAHGTAYKAKGDFDQGTIFGDYFYMELITRLTSNWKKYW